MIWKARYYLSCNSCKVVTGVVALLSLVEVSIKGRSCISTPSVLTHCFNRKVRWLKQVNAADEYGTRLPPARSFVGLGSEAPGSCPEKVESVH